MINQADFNRGLLDFLAASPTPFHAVANIEAALRAAGFHGLRLEDKWQVKPGQRYYVKRNDSSIVAFVLGHTPLAEGGLRMVGAHTDSPCLKVKPRPELRQQGYLQLGVEVYGGVLLNPWFDRDLSLAGRVSFVDEDGKLASALIDFRRPLAVIPSLAIHLDRDVNEGRKINAQRDMPPVLMLTPEDPNPGFADLLLAELRRQNANAKRILDFELSFYDTQAPSLIGVQEEFIASARLDNLASCFVGLQALLAAGEKTTSVLICNDHEEVGSQSAAGAQGPLLNDVLTRLAPDPESRSRMVERSMMVSTDNAHGIHPNYPDKHDANHGPVLNRGPVIKINANQRYASNSETSALFKYAAQMAEVNLQVFVSRADMACGSTIGPLTATAVGVRTVDVGIPTFAMHSIRELAGSRDAHDLFRAILRFQELEQLTI